MHVSYRGWPSQTIKGNAVGRRGVLLDLVWPQLVPFCVPAPPGCVLVEPPGRKVMKAFPFLVVAGIHGCNVEDIPQTHGNFDILVGCTPVDEAPVQTRGDQFSQGCLGQAVSRTTGIVDNV